jgi:hypothetical protein
MDSPEVPQQKSNVITKVIEVEGPDGKMRKVIKKIIIKKKKKQQSEVVAPGEVQ